MRQRTLTFFLREICSRVDEVAGLGRAVEASMDAGNPLKSVEIALGIEQPIYEVSIFLNALSMTLGSTKKTRRVEAFCRLKKLLSSQPT